jgi:NDP-sugar pyrophosphorylase family protein
MDAMILAAGLGTRLRPLTNNTPKPLVKVAGATLLEHIGRRLIAAGVDRIIVNVHHLADQVERFARDEWCLDAELVLSHEREGLLGTGGGLAHAAGLFRRDAPFFLHVGDVIAEPDFRAFYDTHVESGALATLAVHERETARALLFDARGLVGRDNRKEGWTRMARDPIGTPERRPFAGIHVISPDLFDGFVEVGPFDIIDAYLREASDGAWILPYDIGSSRWLEIGNPQRLDQARRVLES